MNGNSEQMLEVCDNFELMYASQVDFQERLTGIKLPADNVDEYQKSVTLLIEEVGELLKNDKRWKNLRWDLYNREEKLNEYADVFITVMNIAIHSGFNKNEVINAVMKKIEINRGRLKEQEEMENEY